LTSSLFRRPSGGRRAAAAAISALLTAASLAAVGLSNPATAATTVTPSEAAVIPGDPDVVRDSTVNIDVDSSGVTYFRNNAASNFAPAAAANYLSSLASCRGDNPAGTNNSPRTTVKVVAPDSSVLLDEISPVRNTSFGGFLTNPPNQPLNPQPAPGNSNVRADFPGNTIGIHKTLDLTGKPAGVYTVTTTTQNMVKTGLGACSIGTGSGTTITPGLVTEVDTFEYRPWQANFKDVFGNGEVNFNITPKEFRWSIGSATSPLYQGTNSSLTTYSLRGPFLLPANPATCGTDPSTCLPQAAVPCVPAESGCIPRIVIINKPGNSETDPNALIGVFDLVTKAFIATAKIGGSARILTSVGTAADAFYHDVLQRLINRAAVAGIDLPTLLATKVIVRGNGTETSLSLLNALQIDPTVHPNGIHISSDATVQAGVILDIYASLSITGNSCVAQSASSSDAVQRFTRSANDGYTVTKTDLLPEVPSVGPLGALVGGPIFHITGKFAPDALVNTATAVIGVDTATDEPHGYPVWISPFVSAGHTTSAKTMDFLGTATWSASETPVGADGCLVVDFMLGAGVAVFNNPLPVSLGTLIDLVGNPNPAAATLTAAVDTALSDALTSAATLPVIDTVLATILGALPAIP
jgi:hypothetical protein